MNEKPTLEACFCVFDSISDIVKYVWDLRNIAKYLNYLEIWLDVNRRILAHQEYKKSWDIRYRKYFFILNIFEKHLKLTIFKELNRWWQNGGGSPKKLQNFKYSQYWWCQEITCMQLFRLNLLWEAELGFERQEIELMQFSINFLTISYRIQDC